MAVSMKCREAQKAFVVLDRTRQSESDSRDLLVEQVERHLSECGDCATEYRIQRLGKAVLRLAGAEPAQGPDREWFAVLKAKIAQQSDAVAPRVASEDSLPGLVWITAKQLIPIMTAVMVIILGVSLFWRTTVAPQDTGQASDRFLFSPQVYEYPQPTRDDVIDTLVAVEDRNGR